MSEQVIIALIASGATVAVATVTAIVAPLIVSRLRRIEQQVANHHQNPDGTPLNLRDDLDTKHDQNHQILLAVQRDVAWILRHIVTQDARIGAIEDTQPKGTK